MKIGNIEIKKTACLAPMAGVADRAFRELCMRFGASYVVGEMASAKGLTLGGKKTAELLELSDLERPGAVQLFGDDPAVMAEAARLAMAYKPDIIDLNMGCPAPKVAGNGGGSALMKNPQLAAEITAAVVAASPVPVTVKIRKGWDETLINAVELATLLEQAGAAAITVHGRTRAQMYAPPADWDIIAKVKAAVSVPVIGNGDVCSAQDALRMYEHTGCDLVMVGRGAQGRPWLFGQIAHYMQTGELLPDPTPAQRMEVMLEHIAQICAYKGDLNGIREARKHAAWYLTGIRGAAALRRASGTLSSYEDAKALAMQVIEQAEQE